MLVFFKGNDIRVGTAGIFRFFLSKRKILSTIIPQNAQFRNIAVEVIMGLLEVTMKFQKNVKIGKRSIVQSLSATHNNAGELLCVLCASNPTQFAKFNNTITTVAMIKILKLNFFTISSLRALNKFMLP